MSYANEYIVKTEKLTAIADSIREKTGETDTITIDEIPNKMNEVFEAGKKSQYDEFWDSFQTNGNRDRYICAFAGAGWDNNSLKPKYLVKPSNDQFAIMQIFMYCNWTGGNNNPIDFSLIADKFDFSQCTVARSAFQCAYMDNIYADFSNCTTLSDTFNHSNGGRTRNVTLKVSEKTKFSNTFAYGAGSYVTFTDDSVIGQNGLNLTRWTGMQHDNLMSVINALKDYSTDTSGTSWVVTFGTTNLAKLTDAEKAIATQKGWTLA